MLLSRNSEDEMTIFNTIGLAKSGDMKDFYIKVVDDTSESGGFYILLSPMK